MTGTLVLGVGNILLADEGAGVHAMHYLEDTHDFSDTRYLDGGTLSFTLAADIAEADNLIVFDAAQLEAEPGAVRVFEDHEVDEFLKSGRRSVHEVGFADLMDIVPDQTHRTSCKNTDRLWFEVVIRFLNGLGEFFLAAEDDFFILHVRRKTVRHEIVIFFSWRLGLITPCQPGIKPATDGTMG